MQHSKNIKRALKAILFVALLILFTLILDASFEPDEEATERMLEGYSKQSDINTIFVGNSAGEMLDADLYSKITGASAFNMCTPSQGLSVSLKNIKMASSQHKIKNVVLLLTFDVLNSDDYSGIDHLYDRVVDSTSPLGVRLINIFKRNINESFSPEIINTQKSINIWIPWENETLHGIDNVRNNITRRFKRLISGDRLGSRIAYDLNTTVYKTIPGDLTGEDISLLKNDIFAASKLPLPENMITADKLTLLAQICTFCQDNDIKLTVIVTPHRSDYYDRYGSFRKYTEITSSYLDTFITERAFVYYDCENDEQLHNKLPDRYYYDMEHILNEYTRNATAYLTDLINSCK